MKNLLTSQLDILIHHTRIFLETLSLPSKDEYLSAAVTAFHDVRAAALSSWNLTYLTFRPICILLRIIGSYLLVVLKVIAQHSIAHGWVALQHGYFQLRTASIWFVRFQRDLPLSAKYAEVGVICVMAILWMLRRRFQKYRYGERAVNWYKKKKQRVLNWYERVVNKVAETSLFLAMLLPHILYVLFVIGMKRLLPSVVTYLATKTYLISFISVWRPLYQTFCVIGKINHNIASLSKKDDATESTKKKVLTPSEIRHQQKHKAKLEENKQLALDLLQYWVVYGILLAICGLAKLAPFIRSLLPVDEAPKPTKSWGFFSPKASKPGFLSRLRLSATFVEEVRLVFFVWLLLMPQSFLRQTEVVDARKSTKKSKSNRPVNVLYDILSPSVISAMKSSAFLSGKVEGSSYGVKAIQFLQSLLGLLVMTRVLSEEWKELIIQTILESTALLPAAVTVLMPSYFTSYGVIYVSLVVPAGYSVEICNSGGKSMFSMDALVTTMDGVSRYLQFWVVSAGVSTILCWFEPVLAWVPLSTHATWFLWAFIQMNSPTRKIYKFVEDELMVFGLLESHDKSFESKDVNDTMLFRTVGRIIAALPSNHDSNEVPKITEDMPKANGVSQKIKAKENPKNTNANEDKASHQKQE